MRRKFNRLAERYGYKVVPVMARVNGILSKRSDVEAVEKYHEWVMTIPTRMYSERSQSHADIVGNAHPSYFECEQKLYNDRFYAAWK